MFWTSEGMPVSCFGAAVYFRPSPGSEVRTKYYVLLTDALGHTCSASAVMLSGAFDELQGVYLFHISLWSDCALQFRAFDFIGVSWEFAKKYFGCTVRWNWFG